LDKINDGIFLEEDKKFSNISNIKARINFNLVAKKIQVFFNLAKKIRFFIVSPMEYCALSKAL
jgi:hypothetical protein